ncbi:MAG: DNA polymerase III subunit delta' [Desulfobacterales bacterium]
MTEIAIDILRGQRALKKLAAFIRTGNIPHAFLLTGAAGTGKQTAARIFAMACNCEAKQVYPPSDDGGFLPQASCNCRACRKIRSGSHPDIHYVEPSGVLIRIDRIREMCDVLAMKPYEAKMRVAIISRSHTMNPEAANALLKMLEEPPDRTVLILTAEQTSDLLPTIVSRCQEVRFTPLSRETVRNLLREKQGLGETEADIMALLCAGNLSKISGEDRNCRDWIGLRNWLIRTLSDMLISGNSVFPAGILLAAEKVAAQKKIITDCLDILGVWLRDLMICRYAPQKVMNRDLQQLAEEVSQKVTLPFLLSKIDAIESARRSLQANANPRLTLEVMMLRLAKGENA